MSEFEYVLQREVLAHVVDACGDGGDARYREDTGHDLDVLSVWLRGKRIESAGSPAFP